MNNKKILSEYYTVMLLPHNRKHTFKFSFNKKTMLLFIFFVCFTLIMSFISYYFLQKIEKEKKIEILEAQSWLDTLFLINKGVKDLYFLSEALYNTGENLYQEIWNGSTHKKKTSYSLSQNFFTDISYLNKSLAFLIERYEVQRHLPLGWPISRNDNSITSEYGKRFHPITRDNNNFHTGYDFANTVGTPIYATADGEVVFAGNNNTGYGNYVRLKHKYGFITLYAHGSRVIAKNETTVKKGDLIMYLGQSGMATGPHLHYEILLDFPLSENSIITIPLNPKPFIASSF